MIKTEGEFIEHISHDGCGSSDGLAVYKKPDGVIDGYCWACETYVKYPYGSEEGSENVSESHVEAADATIKVEAISTYQSAALKDRAISQETVDYFGVKCGFDTSTGEVTEHYYPYHRKGQMVGWKVRSVEDKKFWSVGNLKGGIELFGQHLAGQNGKMILVTEGELDAMAAWQMFKEIGKNYRVVSLPSGANIKGLESNLEWLESFENVILCFDQDDPGRKAAEKACQLLSSEKVKVMSLPEKDANDMLRMGRGNEFMQCLRQASPYRPDGIVTVDELWEEAIRPVERGRDWPWETLTKVTYGRRRKELYGFGGGTGGGKTEGFKEIIQHIVEKDNLPVGLFFLEEAPALTLKVIAGKIANKPFHIPDAGWTTDELKDGITNLKGKVFLYDHFGQKSWDSLKPKIRYMVAGLGIKDIFLDHLTALVADSSDSTNELNRIMSEMASMTHELDFSLYFISHLATPQGTSHEEGGRVTVAQFRGSRAIGFWSNFLFGWERNQQAEDEDERNSPLCRVLKDRYTGRSTGTTIPMFYDRDTGRLEERDEANDWENF